MENNLIFGTGASSSKEYAELFKLVESAIHCNIRRFDTAPSYGTEEILARVIANVARNLGRAKEEFAIQTKIDAWQMQESNGNIRKYVDDILQKMQINYIDTLLIHWPVPDYFDATWETFFTLKEAKIVDKIGVCNVRMRQLERLKKQNCLPQIIQIERNPLLTCEKEIEFCKENNITVQAYSPLCKMHEKIRTSKELLELAEKYQKSIGQVVLRWQLDTGVIPVFTSRKNVRIQEYSNIFDFSLSDADIKVVSNLNINYKMYLESIACPGF